MAKDAKKTQNKKKIKEEIVYGEVAKNIKKVDTVGDDISFVNKKENTDKLVSTLRKVDDNRKAIILFVVGFLLATLVFRCVLWPDRIATLKDGTQPIANIGEKVITADDLYSNMKEYYSVNILLNVLDEMILSDLYESGEELDKKIEEEANKYYTSYENAGYTREQFLAQYGFADEKQFFETLRLDYLRNQYYDEYVLNLIDDKDVEKYYKNEVFGDVDSKHILVSIDEENGLNDEEAKKLAKEIISKLDKGTSWDDVVGEYKDQIINEELGYRAFNADFEAAYLNECKDLKVGTYSKDPVLTSYGYHIVYKIDQKEKPKLEDIKEDVLDVLSEEKKNADANLFEKALFNMRDEAGLEFTDTKLGDEYKEYIDNYK